MCYLADRKKIWSYGNYLDTDNQDFIFLLVTKIVHSNKFCNLVIAKTTVNIKTSKY